MSALQEAVANGPSRNDLTEKDACIWERPWSIEEIRQHSANWSLAADSGLFLFLQDFSQRMLSKTHDIEKQLDSLIRDTKATDSRLHSVFNDFLMLSNTQFIENRVYDEEVEDAAPKSELVEKRPEQEKTREQKEAELIPKMQEAVNYGLRVLESAFEHLDIKAGNSDSEDEDVADRVEAILEPKDLYVDRPLPYLIGSQAFLEQDDVGLGDLSSDEMSVDTESDRDSVIESEESKGSVHSGGDFNPDEDDDEIQSAKKKSSMISFDEDGDSDLFVDSDKDDEDTKNSRPSSFTEELNARIRGEPVNRSEGDRASLSSKKSKGRKETKSAASFASEADSDEMFKPPKMDDDDDASPFGRTSGLFSGGRGLFDDDEDDLFVEAPKTGTEVRKAPNERAPITGADDSLFAPRLENGTPAVKSSATPKQVAVGTAIAGGGGLFDDEIEDDFLNEKSLKSSGVQEKPKKAVDLFDDEDDEDGDIFGEKNSPQPAQTRKEVEDKPSEKKVPPGAVSVFGPGTKSLLSEGLKKWQPSTSEESGKAEEEKAPTAGAGNVSTEQTRTLLTHSLFSDDDEDTQAFPTIPKSQSHPTTANQKKTSKQSFSLFDDEDEEDLFAPATKAKSTVSQNKASTPQPNKGATSSLFSDDEDQWMISESTIAKSGSQASKMKTSTSAPSGLPTSYTAEKSGLFEEDTDDLFAPTNVQSQSKPPRVALLFEDEAEDEGRGTLFEAQSTETTSKLPAVNSQSSEAFQEPEKKEPAQQQKPEETRSTPPAESAESRKKPAGAVSLFGGIDVLANKQTKSQPVEEDADDLFLSKDSPPTDVRKEAKGKTKSVSLFDEEEEDEADWKDPIFIPKMPPEVKMPKPTEERPQVNSTGVFQDEELLFSQTQQKDNDPDVDLFATSTNTQSSKVSSVKNSTQSLFADDEEEEEVDDDDLFSSIKPKPPPIVAEKPKRLNEKAPLPSPEPVSEKPPPNPVKPKGLSSRIGQLQTSLMINPATLLPGSGSSMSGPLSSSSGVSSSSLSPSPATTPIEVQTDGEQGVSFDAPVQVSTLQSVHKGRAKGSALRRPQSRAARQGAAQRSAEAEESTLEEASGSNSSLSTLVLPQTDKSNRTHLSLTLPNPNSPSVKSALSLSQPLSAEASESSPPVTGNTSNKDSVKSSSAAGSFLASDECDLFGSHDLFGANPTPKKAPAKEKASQPQTSKTVSAKKDKEKNTVSSLFDDKSDDLFQSAKPRSSIKKTTSTFLEEEDDDLFGNSSTITVASSKDVKSTNSLSKRDIFEDETPAGLKTNKKHKEKSIHAVLFDDDVDIFADLSDTYKPKPKSKTKGEIKSIFDDDMDDIFSANGKKPAAPSSHKAVKTPSPLENSAAANSGDLFDDPLNALGGN